MAIRTLIIIYTCVVLCTNIQDANGSSRGEYQGNVVCRIKDFSRCENSMQVYGSRSFTFSLTCKNCGLKELTKETFAKSYLKQITEISILDVEENLVHLGVEPFSHFQKLEYLQVNKVPFTQFVHSFLTGLPSLQRVHISNIPVITTLPKDLLVNLPQLEIFDFSQNNIQTIANVDFHHVKKTLRVIYLNENKITFIPHALFGDLSLLEEIDLSLNPIFGLNYHDFNIFSNLKAFNLNHIPCSTLRNYLDMTRLERNGENLLQTRLETMRFYKATSYVKENWWINHISDFPCFQQIEPQVLEEYEGIEVARERLCAKLLDQRAERLMERVDETDSLYKQSTKKDQLTNLLQNVIKNTKTLVDMSEMIRDVVKNF